MTEQFNTCLPIARHRATVLGCSNGEAWKFAAKRVARRMTMDSLVTVLQRYLGFGMSTTGVEHTFATVRDALAHRSHADLRKVKRLLVLTRQCPMQDSEFVTTIVREAREIWMTLHSPARHGGKHYDKGVIGVALSSASRAAWLRGRRDCVTKAVHSDNTNVLAAIPPMPQQHNAPDELMKEIEFQRDKRRKRKFEAFEFNHLCDDEVDADFEADAAAFFKDRAIKHKQAENNANLTRTNDARTTSTSKRLCRTVCILMCPSTGSSATGWEPTSQAPVPKPPCLSLSVWIRLQSNTILCGQPCWSEPLSSLQMLSRQAAAARQPC